MMHGEKKGKVETFRWTNETKFKGVRRVEIKTKAPKRRGSKKAETFTLKQKETKRTK